MKIGDKLVCKNGHTYTLGKGDGFYTFSLLDEFNEIVTLYHDYALEECLPHYEDNHSLHVGTDFTGRIKETYVIKYISV